MKAGSLVRPDQFIVVDDYTFKIKFIRKSKLTLPDLGVPVPIIMNSVVAKAKATKSDPWATEYLHRNPQGSGAFKLQQWKPRQHTVCIRNDAWKSGPLPGVKRVIIREVASASTRRALLLRGDADVSLDLPPKDTKELTNNKKIKIAGVPLGLSAEAPFQLDELQHPDAEQTCGRNPAHAGGQPRLCGARQSFHQNRFRGSAPHSALATLSGCRDAKEHRGVRILVSPSA